MAHPNYEHEMAQARLADVFAAMEGPVCLIGGRAVFITVNERFSKANRQAYAGPSDIDLGFHVDPA